MAAAVPAARQSAIESAAEIGEIAEEADPKIVAVERVKSLPLSQLAVPYQHLSS